MSPVTFTTTASTLTNPNFPQAHLRLAMLLQRQLHDPAGAEEHLRWFRQLRARGKRDPGPFAAPGTPLPSFAGTPPLALPDLNDEVVIVTGLPRAGTSMMMQMLAAGGLPILADGLRRPDESNPRGYFEYEAVRNLPRDSAWLAAAKGQAVKVVAPLLVHLPPELNYRVIFIHRSLEEILDSQAAMLRSENNLERRARLRDEYSRLVHQAMDLLDRSPNVRVLHLEQRRVVEDPRSAAAAIRGFLAKRLSVDAMAALVRPVLHHDRA